MEDYRREVYRVLREISIKLTDRLMENITKQKFFDQLALEQQFYDHSLRAKVLRYDSYYLSRYLYHLRMAEWHDITPPDCGTRSWWDGINTGCGSMAGQSVASSISIRLGSE